MYIVTDDANITFMVCDDITFIGELQTPEETGYM